MKIAGMTVVWLAIALGFGIGEVLTTAFFAVFVVVGALAAAVAAELDASLAIQAIVFAVVSVVGVVAARPPLLRYLRARRAPEMLSGAASLVGERAPVVDGIKGGLEPGHVLIDGERWPALSEDGSQIESGATVRVVGLRQATLIVTKEE